MKAIRKKPGCKPEVIDVENTLEALQAEVEGHIEAVTISGDAVIICNEEGRLLGLPHNVRFCGIEFVGTILIVGYAGDTFCDVPEEAFLMKEVRRNERQGERALPDDEGHCADEAGGGRRDPAGRRREREHGWL